MLRFLEANWPPRLTLQAGVGEQTALHLAANGISALTLVDIDPSGLDHVHQALQASHPTVQVLIVPADVTDEAAVEAAFQETVAAFQRVDIVINAAGVGQPFQSTPDLSKEDWEKVIRVNLTGVWLCQRAAIRQMLAQEYSLFSRLPQAPNHCP